MAAIFGNEERVMPAPKPAIGGTHRGRIPIAVVGGSR